jgi:hypothetical protein
MYFTVPETDDPTGTVVRGLIVPVASTVAVRGPRLTGVVKYFGFPDPFRKTRPAAASTTTAAAAARRRSRLRGTGEVNGTTSWQQEGGLYEFLDWALR